MNPPPPAVVLAAGYGSRLAGADLGLPKALVPVRGRALLSYTLEGLARAGVQRAVVVVGHRGDEVRAALQATDRFGVRIEYVVNSQFHLPNGSSLAAARDTVAGEPFLLLMADHLLSAAAIRLVAGAAGFAVGVDRGPWPPARLVDVTRVRIGPAGRVEAFGKQLDDWNAVDAGIFRCLPAVFEVVDELGRGSEVGAIMTRTAGRFPFAAVDLRGAFWLDVDTPADLAEAERLLARGVLDGDAAPERSL